MNVEYYFNNEYVNIQLGKSNLFLKKIGGGKSMFSELIYEGLSAKGSHNFIFNGLKVDKSRYNVNLVDECFDFDDYLKFKVRGFMFKDFKDKMLDDNEDILNKIVLDFNEKLFEYKFSEYYNRLNDSLMNSEIILRAGIQSIEDIYSEMFSIVFNSEFLSRSSKIEIVIKHMILFRDTTRSNIIIIDDYILKLGNDIVKSILNMINEQYNIYVAFTSSVPICFNFYDNVFLDNYVRLDKELLHQKLFLYDQWDKNGDFNSFYDSNHALVEESDLPKYVEFINKYEYLLYNVSNTEEFFEKLINLL